MKHEGYGREYQYPHDAEDAFVARRNLPEGVSDAPFYEPTERGAERAIAERLAAWRARRVREQEK
jgi:putative ATPase